MLNFIHRIYSRQRFSIINLPDGVLRHALAQGYGRAEPQMGGWRKLRQRAELARRTPVVIAQPVYYHHIGAPGRNGGRGARLALDASGMAWRLPWRSSLAACPLY